jgi:hypothetical protein
MRILGYKDKFIFHPFTILILGDGPAQLEVAGLKLGNANMNCARCLHDTRSDINRHLVDETNRNFNDIMNLCNQAEQFIYKKYTQLNQTEKNICNILKTQGVNPFVNAFNGMPLGSSKSIFDITPPDTLHTLLAGIVKQLCIWILIIITTIGRNDNNFRSNLVILDNRIQNNLLTYTNLPHTHMYYFNNGISSYITSMTQQEMESATHDFSGFRSDTFISILLQLHFCIGYDGNILPNTTSYPIKHNNKTVGNIKNITHVIQYAVIYTLDIFYLLKQDSIALIDIYGLESKLFNMIKYVILVWDIKQ